jgi:hypothetical protein
MQMSDYNTTYRQITNEQLLNLGKDCASLCDDALVAFKSELAARGLDDQDIAEQAERVRKGEIEDSQRKPLAQSFNGFGTKLYGKRNFEPDGSFITTLWVVILWIPLIPLKSIRVKEAGRGPSTVFSVWSRSYLVITQSRPDIRQILNVYAYMLSFFIGAELLDRIHAAWYVAYMALPVWAFIPWGLRQLRTAGH